MSGLSPEEAADRTAIEQVWFEYWQILPRLTTIPNDEADERFASVMVDPALTAARKNRESYNKRKVSPYGFVSHQLIWGPPVGGKDTAVIRDCQNQSKYGLGDLTTMKMISKGPDKANISGTFSRTAQGWKVVGFIIAEGGC